MFEDFSFTSPSSHANHLSFEDDRLMIDTDSLISPLSSRCPSPQSRLRNRRNFRSQPPTSVPFPYDDCKDSKRLSISTLTQKLHEHTLSPGDRHNDRLSPGRRHYAGYVLTPPDTDHDDESLSPSSPTFPVHPSFNEDIRSQRQHISRLQCDESEVDAMRSLIEEPGEEDCHPSSLPPRHSPRRRAATLSRSRFGPEEERRRKSSAGVLASRIEKDRHGHGHGNGKRNEGLRRKSLVSAALASMIEKE